MALLVVMAFLDTRTSGCTCLGFPEPLFLFTIKSTCNFKRIKPGLSQNQRGNGDMGCGWRLALVSALGPLNSLQKTWLRERTSAGRLGSCGQIGDGLVVP